MMAKDGGGLHTVARVMANRIADQILTSVVQLLAINITDGDIP